MSEKRSVETVETKAPGIQPANPMKIRWDESNMKSSYSNVCQVLTTREEVLLLFGINQSMHNAQRELAVQLTDRIILSPYAAKRLATLLTNNIREYEARFGSFDGNAPRDGEAAGT